ncbi:MAG: threonine/serine exporter ThrE family protein [Sphingobacteriales bacterium]
MPDSQQNKEIKELGATLLEIAMLLMVSGASTGRIRNTIDRISTSFSYSANMFISQRTIMLSMYDEENECVFNSLKRTSQHGINFTTLSGISRMSWSILEENWTVKKINEELDRLCALPHYPRIVTLLLTGLAGAAFCRLAGGALLDMTVVFAGTMAGLFVKQEAAKLNFNPYLCVYLAALTSSLIAGSLVKFNPGTDHEFAFATSVLFLIPGVPLINAFSDMIDGNLQNGLIRGMNGFIISFSIALGLLTSMAIYHF